MSHASPLAEDHFVRIRSAFRTDGMTRARLVKPVYSRLERVRFEKEFHYPLHQHQEFEIIHVIQGPYYCKVNGESLELPKDSVLVVQPGDWHEDQCCPPLDYAALVCTLHSRAEGKQIPNLSFFRKETPICRRYANFKISTVLPLMDQIAHEAEINDPITTNLQDLLVEEIFWRVARAFDPHWLSSWLVPSQSKDVFQTQLSAAMAKHVHQPLSVPKLARALGLSQRTLSKRCASLLGNSPARLFQRFKIEQAHRLLAEGGVSVKEVSDRFSFADPYHFSRAFKAVTGYPPSQASKGLRCIGV